MGDGRAGDEGLDAGCWMLDGDGVGWQFFGNASGGVKKLKTLLSPALSSLDGRRGRRGARQFFHSF